MFIFDIFERSFYINLVRRVDRKCDTEKELDRVGIVAERFEAIEPDDRGGFKNRGKRGCTISHTAVIRMAKTLDLESVLVMEDDVMFADNIHSRMEVLAPMLNVREWDMFYFQATRPKRITDRFGDTGLVKIDGTLNAHCYGVHRRAYDVLLAALDSNERRVIDLFLMRSVHPRLNVYAAHPALARQRKSPSDVTRRGRDHKNTAPTRK